MYDYTVVEREKKKAMTKAEKLEAKAKKDEEEEAYKFAILDGRKEKVGNFRIEPPGLFRGRGAHPKTGMLKVSLAIFHIDTKLNENMKDSRFS